MTLEPVQSAPPPSMALTVRSSRTTRRATTSTTRGATEASPTPANLPTLLLRLAAESGLWANAGGRFGDLSDARAWLARSPRIRAAHAATTTTAATPVAAPSVDSMASFADATVTWTLAPFFKGCELLDSASEIQVSTLCSRVLVQSMLQVFVLVSIVAELVRHHCIGRIHVWYKKP